MDQASDVDEHGNDDGGADNDSSVTHYYLGSKTTPAADPVPISDCPEFYRLCEDLRKFEITSVPLWLSTKSTADHVARLDQAASALTDVTVVLGERLEPNAALALGKWLSHQTNLQRLTVQLQDNDNNYSSIYYNDSYDHHDNNTFCALDLFWDCAARNSSWKELTIVGERPALGPGVARILNPIAFSRHGRQRIHKLTLRNCTLQDFDSVALVRLINHGRRERHHGRPDDTSISDEETSSLEQLHLVNCTMNSTDTIRIVKAMTRNTTVTSFALLLTRMAPLQDPECASALADFIRLNNRVTDLTLTAVGNNHHHYNHNRLLLLQALSTAMEDNVSITSFCLTASTRSSVTATASTPRRLDSMDRHVPARHYRTHHQARTTTRRNHNYDNPHYLHARPSRRRLNADPLRDDDEVDDLTRHDDDAIHPGLTINAKVGDGKDENLAVFYHSKIQHYVALNRAGRKYLKEDATDRPNHETIEDCWFRMLLEHGQEHALVFSLLRDYPTILVETTVLWNK